MMNDEIKRLVSGTASISIPAEWERFREVYLYTALVRPPSNPYLNRNWTPAKARYGTVVIMGKGEYARGGYPIEFEQQSFKLFSLQTSQNLLALICALEAILESLVNLSIAIPDTFPISKNNPIEGFRYEAIDFDRCVITCYADTALQITLKGISLDQCKETDGLPEPPPLPPPPPPRIPPGTRIDGQDGRPSITPPQENEPPELNVPFDEDSEEPPNNGTEECVVYDVLIRSKAVGEFNPISELNYRLYGEIVAIRIVNDAQGGRIEANCRGQFFNNPDGCGELEWVLLEGGGTQYDFAEIVSITQVS